MNILECCLTLCFHPLLSCGFWLHPLLTQRVLRSCAQMENPGLSDSKKQTSPADQSRENGPVAKRFKMSSHVHLEGLGATSGGDWERTLEMPRQWLTAAHEAFGNETVQISIATICLKSLRIHRGTWLIQEDQQKSCAADVLLCFSCAFLFLTEVPKPAYLGGYGHWCLPGRHQETDSSVYSKSSLCTNKHITMCFWAFCSFL